VDSTLKLKKNKSAAARTVVLRFTYYLLGYVIFILIPTRASNNDNSNVNHPAVFQVIGLFRTLGLMRDGGVPCCAPGFSPLERSERAIPNTFCPHVGRQPAFVSRLLGFRFQSRLFQRWMLHHRIQPWLFGSLDILHRLLFFSSSRTLPADYDSSWKFVLMLMSTCTWTEPNVPLRDFLCIATALFPCTIIHHPSSITHHALSRFLSRHCTASEPRPCYSFSSLVMLRSLCYSFRTICFHLLLSVTGQLLQPSFPSFFPTVTCTCTTLLYRCAHS